MTRMVHQSPLGKSPPPGRRQSRGPGRLVQALGLATYPLVLLFGLLVAGALLATSDHYEGCMLFASSEVRGQRRAYIDVSFTHGHHRNCDYVITASFLSACYALVAGVGIVLHRRITPNPDILEWARRWVLLPISALQLGLSFVAACLVSSGYAWFCHSYVKQIHPGFLTHTASCSAFDKVDYTATFGRYKGKFPFTAHLNIATAFAWLLTLTWLANVALKVVDIRSRASEGQYDVNTSLTAARDKLPPKGRKEAPEEHDDPNRV